MLTSIKNWTQKHPESSDIFWMQKALKLAKYAAIKGEIPVGAVIVIDNKIVGCGWNQPIATQDPSAHAEIIALRHAAKRLRNYRLIDAELFVTLEPCIMCVGAMLHARIKRLVYGTPDPKTGAVESVFTLLGPNNPHNHKIAYTDRILAEPCGQLLKDFFKQRRN